jgi:hypothetical protein
MIEHKASLYPRHVVAMNVLRMVAQLSAARESTGISIWHLLLPYQPGWLITERHRRPNTLVRNMQELVEYQLGSNDERCRDATWTLFTDPDAVPISLCLAAYAPPRRPNPNLSIRLLQTIRKSRLDPKLAQSEGSECHRGRDLLPQGHCNHNIQLRTPLLLRICFYLKND